MCLTLSQHMLNGDIYDQNVSFIPKFRPLKPCNKPLDMTWRAKSHGFDNYLREIRNYIRKKFWTYIYWDMSLIFLDSDEREELESAGELEGRCWTAIAWSQLGSTSFNIFKRALFLSSDLTNI